MKQEDGPLKPTTMRLPTDLKRAIRKQAAHEGRSASNLTVFILREGLARRRKMKGVGHGVVIDK